MAEELSCIMPADMSHHLPTPGYRPPRYNKYRRDPELQQPWSRETEIKRFIILGLDREDSPGALYAFFYSFSFQERTTACAAALAWALLHIWTVSKKVSSLVILAGPWKLYVSQAKAWQDIIRSPWVQQAYETLQELLQTLHDGDIVKVMRPWKLMVWNRDAFSRLFWHGSINEHIYRPLYQDLNNNIFPSLQGMGLVTERQSILSNGSSRDKSECYFWLAG